MDAKQEEELLELLDRIATGIDRIGAALTIQVSDQVKHETPTTAAISEKTQELLLGMEAVRTNALRELSKTAFPS